MGQYYLSALVSFKLLSEGGPRSLKVLSLITTYMQQQQHGPFFYLSCLFMFKLGGEAEPSVSEHKLHPLVVCLVATETRCSAAEVARQLEHCSFLGHLSSGGCSGAHLWMSPASPTTTPPFPGSSRVVSPPPLPASRSRAPSVQPPCSPSRPCVSK